MSLHDLSKDELIHIIMSMEAHHRAKTEVKIRIGKVECDHQIVYDSSEVCQDSNTAFDAIATADFTKIIHIIVFASIYNGDVFVPRVIIGSNGRVGNDLYLMKCYRCESYVDNNVNDQIRDFIKSVPSSERFRWSCAESTPFDSRPSTLG